MKGSKGLNIKKSPKVYTDYSQGIYDAHEI